MIAESLPTNQQWQKPPREVVPCSFIQQVSPDASSLTLEQLKVLLPRLLSQTKSRGLPNDVKCEYVADLFRRLVFHKREWQRYAHVDTRKNYTRNLVATDGETYSLILMCWNPGKESPIHDHPCDGCWVRVFEGSVQEVRYVADDKTGSMICTAVTKYNEGEISFMHDSMGYHKIGNPSRTAPAITMHLYSPPFDKCNIWLDPSNVSKPSNVRICFFSEKGELVNENV